MRTPRDHIDLKDVTDTRPLRAGAFSAWLGRTRATHAGDGDADVPCGSCSACCRSGYFVHIAPDEADALGRIPPALLFAAPGLPEGHVLMGYDEHGRCPMLVEDQCSIYAHRPQTCRKYDCRVLPAAGIDAGDDKPLINARIARWRFDYPDDRDRPQHTAVQAAAAFLRHRAALFPNGLVPGNPPQLAMLAVKVATVFVDHPGEPARSDAERVRAVLAALEAAAEDAR